MLAPVLHLIIWTLIVWAWMYALRIPAMQKAGIDPQDALHPGSLDKLPTSARCAADNYNHLHEAPTLFYALAIYTHLAGQADGLNVGLAWAYVALRIGHSLAQIVVKNVTLRFGLFALSTIVLIVITARNLIALAS
ncbi:MAG: MAPEG family protein [Pseudomonadota bacterium]